MIVWTWTDSRPSAALDAISRAKSGAWTPDARGMADLAALMASTVYFLGAVTGQLKPPAEGIATVRLQSSPPWAAGWKDAGEALALTPLLLNPERRAPTRSFATSFQPTDTGLAWPATVAIVAGAVALVAISAAWVAQNAGPVIDRHLARVADTQRLIASHAKLLEASAAHHEREQREGKPLPWDAAETLLLGELRDVQARVQAKTETPLEMPASGLVLGAVALVAVATLLGDPAA